MNWKNMLREWAVTGFCFVLSVMGPNRCNTEKNDDQDRIKVVNSQTELSENHAKRFGGEWCTYMLN
jgi:hypothetical protein